MTDEEAEPEVAREAPLEPPAQRRRLSFSTISERELERFSNVSGSDLEPDISSALERGIGGYS